MEEEPYHPKEKEKYPPKTQYINGELYIELPDNYPKPKTNKRSIKPYFIQDLP